MRGTAIGVCLCLLIGVLGGCPGKYSQPRTTLKVHARSAGPPDGAVPTPPSTTPPETSCWWTYGGNNLRQFRAMVSGPGAKPRGQEIIPLLGASYGPVFSPDGTAWFISDGAICRLDATTRKVSVLTDRSAWDYRCLLSCPDDTLVTTRIPLEHQLSSEEFRDNWEALQQQVQLVSLDEQLNVRWQWDAGRQLYAPLQAPDGSIYVLAPPFDRRTPKPSSTLFAISASGGLLWELEVADIVAEPYGLARSTEGVLYFASATGRLYAVTPAGKVAWVHSAPQLMGAKAVEYGDCGKVLITDNGDIVYSAGGDRLVYCVSPDGKERWSFRPWRDFTFNLALAPNGDVILADHRGKLYCLDPQGTWRWEMQVNEFMAPILVVDALGNIYCACADLTLRVVDPSGNEVFHDNLPGWPLSVALDSRGTYYCTTKQFTTGDGQNAVYLVNRR